MTDQKEDQFLEIKSFFTTKLDELITLARNSGLKTVGNMFFAKSTDHVQETLEEIKRKYENLGKLPKLPKVRKASAYILFSRDERERVRQENPSLSFGHVSKLLGKIWKEQPKEVKEKYLQISNVYVKQPKKKRIYKKSVVISSA